MRISLQVCHGHSFIYAADQHLVRHRLVTREGWDESALADANTHIYVYFSVDSDERPERQLWIDVRNGTLFARMSTAIGPFEVFGFAQVWKPGPKSVVVEFPRSLLGKHISSYRYSVRSSFHEDFHPECGGGGDAVIICADVVPWRGWIEHRHVPK